MAKQYSRIVGQCSLIATILDPVVESLSLYQLMEHSTDLYTPLSARTLSFLGALLFTRPIYK